MTFLLYTLLLAFILIETPLVSLMVYLYTHRTTDVHISTMRRIIFILACAKAFFIMAQIILVFDSLFKFPEATNFVIWSYSISVFVLAAIDWWAFFSIKKIIK